MPNLGVGSLISTLKAHDIPAGFVHELSIDETVDRYRDLMGSQSYSAVGFSVFNHNYQGVKEFSRRIKSESPSTIIVWGGILPSTIPSEIIFEDIADRLTVDFIMKGYAETALVEFMQNLHGMDIYSSPNIVYKKGGRIISNQIKDIDLETLPWGDHEYIGYAVRKTNHKTINVDASRDECQGTCTFCGSPQMRKLHGGRATKKDPESVLQEIKYWNAEGYSVFLNHSDFFADRRYAWRFVDLLESDRSQIDFRIFGRAGSMVRNSDLIMRMYNLKNLTLFLELGVESNNDAILRMLKKGSTKRMNDAAVDVMTQGKGAKAKVSGAIDYILFPHPDVTASQLDKHITELEILVKRSKGCGIKILPVATKIIPYSGTELWHQLIERGLLPDPRKGFDITDYPFKDPDVQSLFDTTHTQLEEERKKMRDDFLSKTSE
jgi:radical SAM superfamily enzyme YgiQ (UPF0313 family)